MSIRDDLRLNRRFVITGGPGSGKTSVAEALGTLGFTIFPELARELFTKGIRPFPEDGGARKGRFFATILSSRIEYHQQIKTGETAFYDRGLPDSLAYFRYQSIPIPERLMEAISRYRYHPVVFLAPPWEAIFRSDPQRQETFEQAIRLHELTVGAYQEAGYDLLLLPLSSIGERVRFILDYLDELNR